MRLIRFWTPPGSEPSPIKSKLMWKGSGTPSGDVSFANLISS